jgi:serine/threonine protein kinase
MDTWKETTLEKNDKNHLCTNDISVNDSNPNDLHLSLHSKPYTNGLIRQRYQIHSFLGKGSFSEVYYAKCIVSMENTMNLSSILPSSVAIKFDIQNTGIVRHESTILYYLQKHHCQGIPTLFWFGRHENIPCMMIPCYEVNLKVYMTTQDSRMTKEEYDDIGHCLLRIVDHLHTYDIIHRDIKPENFMKSHHQWILIDFGFATIWRDVEGQSSDTSTTEKTNRNIDTEIPVGNPYYISPYVHRYHTHRPKDDHISVCYIILHMWLFHTYQQGLPWIQPSISMNMIYQLKSRKHMISWMDSLFLTWKQDHVVLNNHTTLEHILYTCFHHEQYDS